MSTARELHKILGSFSRVHELVTPPRSIPPQATIIMAAAVDAALPPTITCAPFYLNLVVVDSSAAVESKVEEKVGKGMFGLKQKAATALAKAVVNDTKIAGKLAEKLTEVCVCVCVWGGGCTGDVCSLAAGLNQNSNLAGGPSLTRATSRPAAASSPAVHRSFPLLCTTWASSSPSKPR